MAGAARNAQVRRYSAPFYRVYLANMAKGLRSKSKRANRALIRKTVTAPIVQQRQAQMAEALRKELEEKRGDSIRNLASLMPGAKVQKDEDEMDGDEEEDAADVEAQQGGKIAKTGSKQKGFSFLRRDPKTKGSKPRNNPGKEMVWFK
jgi:hypothetical protein